MSSSQPSPSQAFLPNVLLSLSAISPQRPSTLLSTSTALLTTFHAALRTSTMTMLPSYTTSLPTGTESGSAIAIDLGGSTLRTAVVALRPHAHSVRGPDTPHLGELMRVRARGSWDVGPRIKELPGGEFFDWIAARVGGVVSAAGLADGGGRPVGVTWSFPVEQTGPASGTVQQMGKGYTQWREIAGTDLRVHFEAAFARAGLKLRMTALMNDTEATLLSHAFANPATRISLILGTGCNAALQLPISAVSKEKLGQRRKEWMAGAKTVLVNTEISMFGAGVFHMSDVDRELDAMSDHPGFQPFEQFTSGRYLGEICRLILTKGVLAGALFGGQMPKGLDSRFNLDTSLMSKLERESHEEASEGLLRAFGFETPPSQEDITIVRAICRAASERAAVYLAIAIFVLWRLQRDSTISDSLTAIEPESSAGPIAVAYCGAVVEKHPTIRPRCQEILDILVEAESEAPMKRRLVLEEAGDSGIMGAAVGALMNEIADSRIGESKL